MSTKKNIYMLTLGLFLFSQIAIASENSPSIYFEKNNNLAVNQISKLDVFIDSAQPINAYLFDIFYNPREIKIENISTANSIIDVKQKEPEAVDGKISVNGGSTESFSGQKGILLSLNIVPLKIGIIKLEIKNPSVYLANGKGTKVIPAAKAISLDVQNSSTTIEPDLKEDKITPIIEIAEISSDPITPTQNLLIFKVADQDSGIKSVKIQKKRWLGWSTEEEVINPTSLPKNIWSVKILVSDWSLNESQTIVYNWLAFWTNLLPILSFLLIFCIIVINRIIRKKKAIINK
jgi:hypothetical protein